MNRALVVLAALLAGPAQDSEKEKAVQWMKDNNKWNSDAPIVKGFTAEVEKSIADGTDCRWLLGEGLIKAKKPYLLSWHDGQFFATELTAAQAAALKVEKMSVSMTPQGAAREGLPAKPLAVLSAADIKDVAALAPDQAITGKIAFKREREQAGDIALRLTFSRVGDGGTTTVDQWHYVKAKLDKDGSLEFKFGETKGSDGPLLVFVTLCAVPDPKSSDGRKAVSNTVAVLVNIARSGRASEKDKAIQWMKDNNAWKAADALIVKNFTDDLETIIKDGKDCRWVVGKGLTKQEKPFLLAWHDGQFFAIELTAKQASAMWGEDESIAMTPYGAARDSLPAKPTATLTTASITDAKALAPDQEVKGKVAFKREAEPKRDVALRLSYRIVTDDGTTTVEKWHYVDSLDKDGEIEFKFGGIEAGDGPLLVFVTLCDVPDPKDSSGRKPVSNTVPVLVNIKK